MRFYFFLSLFILFFQVKSQSNDAEAAIYNIGFGAIFSTVGAIINKKPDEPLGRVIKKSLWQGALGGYITFESKRLLREAQEQDKWEYIWAAKLVNATGTSIKENAALNLNFWERWHINIGFNRIEFRTKNKFSIHYKIMPIALIYTTDAFFRYDFELNNTLRTGELVFKTENLNGGNEFIAQASAGYIVFESNYLNNKKTITHEIIHIYQSNDFSIFNTYFQKPLNDWSNKNRTITQFNKIFYPDLHYLILRPLYLIERNSAHNYYDNFFEHEAGYYSNTLNNFNL